MPYQKTAKPLLIYINKSTMRKFIVAGNWKMNLTYSEAQDLMLRINRFVVNNDQQAEVVIAPPYLYLKLANDTFHNNQVQDMAQEVSSFEKGAHTGDISAEMLKSIGVEYCLIGHSERRQYHYETDETLAQKANLLIQNGIQPMFCCGESLNQRERGTTLRVIQSQISHSLFHLSAEDFSKVVIAYEPIWAIGTGEVATPEQAEEVHAFIRKIIMEQYGDDVAHNTSILYGGSVNPSNALSIFQQPDVDGGLIGGASLNADDFISIIKKLDQAKSA